MRLPSKSALLLSSALMLAGCDSFQASPAQQVVAELGMEIAVARFIDGDRGRAERIGQLLTAVGFFVDDEDPSSHSVGEVFAIINDGIAWDRLTPAEQRLAAAVIGMAEGHLYQLVPGAEALLNEEVVARILAYIDAAQRAVDATQ